MGESGGERVVLVTGAGKGLGAAFATILAANGARVIVNNRTRPGEPSSAEAIASDIRRSGGLAIAETSDVTAPGAARALCSAALDSFGRLDALILNAGVNGPAARVATGDPAAFRDVLEINFHANVTLVQAALPHLIAAPSGRILFVSSTAGLYGVRGRAAYAASKGALNAFALSLAAELRRDRVGVNILMPYAATQMTKSLLTPERMAAMAPEAAAPAARWLVSPFCTETGGIWVAGGGRFRRAAPVEFGIPAVSLDVAQAAGLADPRTFADAEAAFADFLASAPSAEQAAAE